MTHTRWIPITPNRNTDLDLQFGYVRGYILALEDVINDLQESDSGDIMDFLDQVNRTLESANRTLKTLEHMEGRKDHGEPREHGEVDQGPGVRGT